MPPLIRLYIRQCAIGFALSLAFVGLLFALNIGNLWHLVTSSDVGLLAALMLVVFNGIVFSGVQFGIAVMRMGTDDTEPPSRGRHDPVSIPVLAHGPREARRG